MFDMSQLTRLMSMGPEGISSLAGAAAMKAPPPNLGGMSNPAVLSPEAFSGFVNPAVAQMAQASPMQAPSGMPAAGGMPGMAGMIPGLSPQQASILHQQGQQQPLHFPGASLGPRAGNIQTQSMGVPQVQAPHPSLAQLLGG